MKKLIEKFPALRFVAPFVRTPRDIMLSGPLTHTVNILSNIWVWMRRG